MKSFDAAIVLSHMFEPDGSTSQQCKDRTAKGVELYKSRDVTNLVFTGGRFQREFDYSQAAKMYEQAAHLGVHRAILEEASLETVGQFVFTLRDIVVPNGWRNLLIVTSDYHTERAQEIGRLVFGDVYAH